MAKWNEKDHPRDEEGQFTEKWAARVSAAIGRALGGNYTPGEDLLHGGADWDAIGRGMKRSSIDPDGALEEIYVQQGYHGRPEVVDEMQMRTAISEGAVELWRGVEHYYGRDGDKSAAAINEEYRTGDTHYGGQGVFGNGTYTSTIRGVAWTYAADREDGMIRLALRPDARVALASQLEKLWHAEQRSLPNNWDGHVRMAMKEISGLDDLDALNPINREKLRQQGEARVRLRQAVIADLGRYAALLGYDAIQVDTAEKNKKRDGVYIILNRTATIAQKAA